MKNLIKEKRGITLIALVITIVILIILAGVLVSLTLGNNGLFKKAKLGSEEYNQKAATEAINFKITNVQISKYAEEQRMPTLKELADDFCDDNDFEYVEETTQVAGLTHIENQNPDSIFTKLKAYPYEFEIDSSLKLASIDGIKLANTQPVQPVNPANTEIKQCKIEIDDYGWITVTDIEDMVSFSIIINDVWVDTTKESTYRLMLDYGETNYIYVIALDRDANIYKSEVVTYEQQFINYRYFKMEITQLRTNSSDIIQFTEFCFFNASKTSRYSYKSGASITTDLPQVYISVSNLIDGSTNGSKFSGNWGGRKNGKATFYIDLGEGNEINAAEYPYYGYYTAEDQNPRDPVTWNLYASQDGTNYDLVDSKENADITTSRNALTDYWTWQ